MEEIKSILLSLGYQLKDDGARYWRALPIYREGNNPTALRISKKNGTFVDFAENQFGSFNKLIQLSLGLAKLKDAKKWLDDKKYTVQSVKKETPKIIMTQMFDTKMLKRLIKNHDYWNKRGIKNEVLEQFQGGVATEGRMANRYVFPIFDDQYNKILGFAGRDITKKHTIKWKLIGEKMKWAFPLYINRSVIIERKEVILVESIGDMLQLWQSGFDHVLCLFGTYISDKIISSLVGLGLKKIYISVNNDVDNNNVGNRKACDIYLRLIKFIDRDKIQIKLPLKKDFGEMNEIEIKKWKELKNLAIIGTREFHDYDKLKEELEPYKIETGMIVSGGAIGTDTLGKRWGNMNKIPVVEFIPEWDKYGKAAGFIRNEYIIRNADEVVAVWRPGSRGTENDIDIAKKLNKPMKIITYSA